MKYISTPWTLPQIHLHQKPCLIDYPCSNFNGGLIKPSWALMYGWVIMHNIKHCMWILIHAQCQLTFVNTLRPRQNGRYFADDIFNRIFVNKNVRISIKFSLKFVPKGLINNIPALVQIMAWRRPGDQPLSEPVMFSLLTHICVTRPQLVKKDGLYGHRYAVIFLSVSE